MNTSIARSPLIARASPCCCWCKRHACITNNFKAQLSLRKHSLFLPASSPARRKATPHRTPHKARPVLVASATAASRLDEQPKVNPLRQPFAAWQQWWCIGATAKADLPKSQKFSRILARLWGFVKHSKRTLSFAVCFMVRRGCAYITSKHAQLAFSAHATQTLLYRHHC